MKREEQIEKIHELIMEIAAGNLDANLLPSGNYDELDAIAVGINMLAEELKFTTVSKNYLNSLYQGVVDMLVVLNPENKIQQVNEAVFEVLGFDSAELVGMPFDVLCAGSKKVMQNILKEVGRDGTLRNEESLILKKTGIAVPVSLSASVLYDENRNETGKLLVLKDISVIKETQNKLLARNEELNTLIYRAAHDLKGPLASIQGLVNLARLDSDRPEAIPEYINMIEQSANKLDTILMEFLEIGRITHSSVMAEDINLEAFIKDILSSLSHSAGFDAVKKSLKIKVTKPLHSKASILKTVIQNLIENSLKYRKLGTTNSRLTIEAIDAEGGVQIAISDNGIGMDSLVKNQIFKMFYRGSNQGAGSGLGLYIVKRAVDILNGTISVSSTPGKGSTFTVFLPHLE